MWSTRRKLTLLAALPLVLSAAVVSAQTPEPSNGAATPKEGLILDGPTPSVLMMYTGDVVGYLETCGCKKNPAGGLPRRSWVLNQLKDKFPQAPLVLLDSGNFSDRPTPEGDVRTHALLTAMEQMGYGAVNVGERDLKMGYDEFHKRTAESGLQFISANIVDQSTQEPVFTPRTIVEAVSPDGSQKRRIGVTGVARFNPIFLVPGPESGNLVIAQPAERVRAEVEALRAEGVDLVVLLAALHKDDARRILSEVPGVDFVIGAYGGIFTQTAETAGETRIIYSGNQGKRFGETRVFLDEGGAVKAQVTDLHFLTRRYPVDQAMLDFVNEAAAEEEEVDRSSRTEPAPTFVGSATCRSCHSSEHAHWTASAHADAYRTLETKGEAGDASCRSCHVTGAGMEGGFVSVDATPHLAEVGCESCHGAGAKHLEYTQMKYGAVSLASCTSCHDAKNSPDFDYYADLPRVDHSAPSTARTH